MESSDSDVTAMESSSPSLPSNGASSSRTLQLPLLRLLQFPVSSLLEYTGILTARSADYPYSESRTLIPDNTSAAVSVQHPRILEPVDGLAGGANSNNSAGSSTSRGEVAIRIFGERERSRDLSNAINGDVGGDGLGLGESTAGVDIAGGSVSSSGSDGDRNSNRNESAYQRYDVQQATRWIEQVLPFSLLLLMVFIRQHFMGFCVSIYITVVLYKSNEILRKQTALKGERKILILLGYSFIFLLHTLGVYWWNQEVELFYPLLMIPPKAIPPFWHAIFIILVNDTLVRQSAMILKLFLLIYYKNGRGHNFRSQGQMLTLIEYTVLLYRALLPTPVWYKFFLNKEYGSLFSSLTTGLYLTLKLMSIVDKVRSFIISFKALSRKEVQYGSYATAEQVNAAGDLCAICQEKMHSPILLRCKHIFCEECVSEWFERERTCPLCRAMVRPAELKSYGDGSTNLLFHLF